MLHVQLLLINLTTTRVITQCLEITFNRLTLEMIKKRSSNKSHYECILLLHHCVVKINYKLIKNKL